MNRGVTAELDDLEGEVADLRVRLAGCEAAAAPQRPTDVEAIEGLGVGGGRRLEAIGLTTGEQLLEPCATDEGIEPVREGATDGETHGVHAGATMADLMRVRGIAGQWAELLRRSGITSVHDLASRDAATFLPRMEAVNDEEHRVPESPGAERPRELIAGCEEPPGQAHHRDAGTGAGRRRLPGNSGLGRLPGTERRDRGSGQSTGLPVAGSRRPGKLGWPRRPVEATLSSSPLSREVPQAPSPPKERLAGASVPADPSRHRPDADADAGPPCRASCSTP